MSTEHYLNAGHAVSDITRQLLRLAYRPKQDGTGRTAEIINVSFSIPGGESVIASNARRFNYRAMIAESIWNLTYTSDISFLEQFLPSIRDFCGGKQYANWAYGPHIYDAFENCVSELMQNPTSRQATIMTASFQSSDGNSPPCLLSVQWLVREGKLIQIVNMRSNDVYLGLPLDIFQFSLWHKIMASALGLETGVYIHNAGSMHLYHRDIKRAEFFVTSPHKTHSMPAVSAGAFQGLDTVRDYVLGKNDNPEGLENYTNLLQRKEPMHTLWTELKEEGHGRGW